MFTRIVRSSKVQAAFASLLVAILVEGGSGYLTQETSTKLVEAFLTYVVPALLLAGGIEDHGRNQGAEKTRLELEAAKWEKVPDPDPGPR